MSETYISAFNATHDQLAILNVNDCKKDSVEARMEVTFADQFQPGAPHIVVTLITYYDKYGDPCEYGVWVRGYPDNLGVGAERSFSLEPSENRGEQAVAPAAARIDGFVIFQQDSLGNFEQVLMRATQLPPIGFGKFLNDILLDPDPAGSYQKMVGLFDDDTVATGTAVADRFDTGAGDDTILAKGGGDTVYKWNPGDLTYSGGRGSDSLIFEPADGDIPNPPDGAVANLRTGKGQNPFGGKLSLDSVENVSGTAHDDMLTGNIKANFLYSGHGGADRIHGLGGDDSILVDHNFGTISSGRRFDGGAGSDTLSAYIDAAFGESRLDLVDQARNTGAFAGGIFLGFERFDFLGSMLDFYSVNFAGGASGETVHGGSGADRLNGRGGGDRLAGLDGADRLIGAKGRDLLDGGTGKDVMTGGGARDTFVFSAGYGLDRITDFDKDADRIDLRGLPAITAFADVLAAASDVTNGVAIQAGADRLVLAGIAEADLRADDFIF